jgi:Na+/H+-dicarboxylate symporter
MWKKISVGLPLRLLLIIGFALLAGDFIPVQAKSYAYAISLTLKDALMFVMPFIIFAYIFSCLVSFRDGTFKFLASLMGSVCLSNFICTLIAFSLCYYTIPYLGSLPTHTAIGHVLDPAWTWSLPSFITNDKALFGGILAAIVVSLVSPKNGSKVGDQLKSIASWILNRGFIPLLPLFVLGFVLKIEHEGRLASALMTYGPVVMLFVSCQILYIGLLFGVNANFKWRAWVQSILTALPAGLTGFSTMSSLAAMPLTLKAAQTNSGNNPLVDVVVPATVNVHLMGDSIAIPTMALAILSSYGLVTPDVTIYLVFAFYFVMNKFAVAAVPGGGILVMMPVLQQYLGFNDEMLSLIMMLYILFDALITTANVMGNNVFAILFTKVYSTASVEEKKLAKSKF